MIGKISSFETLGCVDGPGLRTVVFAAGCPLRCIYCHNPETWSVEGDDFTVDALVAKLLRFKPYLIRGGGVTFSGGEPLLQADFFAEVAERLKHEGLHVTLDTSGHGGGAGVERLISFIDLALVDVKFTTEEAYRAHTGGSLDRVLRFLDGLLAAGKHVWIRHVVVPRLTDSEENIRALAELVKPYLPIVDRVELLPFRKFCEKKYEQLGVSFPLTDRAEADAKTVERLLGVLAECGMPLHEESAE